MLPVLFELVLFVFSPDARYAKRCQMPTTTANCIYSVFPADWEALLGLASPIHAAPRKEKKETHLKIESTLILNGHSGRNCRKLFQDPSRGNSEVIVQPSQLVRRGG